MHEFHFHEDDVGQIQVMPIENWRYCERELKALAEHTVEHLAPGGVGWTKLYEFSEDPDSLKDTRSLKSLGITQGRFVELLSPCGKQYDRLVSPLSEIDAALGIRSIGFGPSGHAGIIADLEGNLVVSIWCALPGSDRDENAMLANMLTALSLDHHLLLVDWAWLQLVDLGSRESIESYLSAE